MYYNDKTYQFVYYIINVVCKKQFIEWFRLYYYIIYMLVCIIIYKSKKVFINTYKIKWVNIY